MDATELPARPSLEQYRKQAKDLTKARQSGDPAVLLRIGRNHPRLHKLPEAEFRSAPFALADAQLVIAREHGFESWPKFVKYIQAVNRETSPVSHFELAADAIVAGDAATLERLLRDHPELVRARSMRAHNSTLLHYVSANGVEDFRQKTPKNAVAIARILLNAGAAVDADGSPGHGTTLGLVATSIHPLIAGVQIPLLETLLNAGAAVDGAPGGWNPLTAALANGRGQAAWYLATRGARMDLEGAAGVGRLDVVESLKAHASEEQIRSGFAWACQYGRTSVVDFLLRNGVGVDVRLRHNGQTGLHWAAYTGHSDTVKLLLERQAPVEAKDESFGGTPLGWALYGWAEPAAEGERGSYYEVVGLLIAAGAILDSGWLAQDRDRPQIEQLRADPQMRAALRLP